MADWIGQLLLGAAAIANVHHHKVAIGQLGSGVAPMPTLRNCSIMLMVSSLLCQFCFTLLAFSRRVRIRLTTASYTASRSPAVKPSMPNAASLKAQFYESLSSRSIFDEGDSWAVEGDS